MKFYDAFRSSFRRFALWDGKMDHLKLTDDYLPPLGSGVVHLPSGTAAELLMHFRSFWADYQSGMSWFGDPHWKESDEMYHVMNNNKVLDPHEYLDLVEEALGSRFSLVMRKLRERGKTVTFLSRHFSLSSKEHADLIPQVTRKLECILQKDVSILKHYAAAVIFDDDGKVLLCKRAAYKKIAPNMWHLPGGAVELDENPIEAIKRELKEELNLDATAVFPTRVKLTYTVDGGYLQTHVFFVEAARQQPVLMNEENSEFRFVTQKEISELIEPNLVDDNIRAVRAADALRRVNS
jgi:8-oxo-dGTP diphosphatase